MGALCAAPGPAAMTDVVRARQTRMKAKHAITRSRGEKNLFSTARTPCTARNRNRGSRQGPNHEKTGDFQKPQTTQTCKKIPGAMRTLRGPGRKIRLKTIPYPGGQVRLIQPL